MIAALVAATLALAQAAPAPLARERIGDAQLVGQRLITGFDGQSPPASLVKRVRAGRPRSASGPTAAASRTLGCVLPSGTSEVATRIGTAGSGTSAFSAADSVSG